MWWHLHTKWTANVAAPSNPLKHVSGLWDFTFPLQWSMQQRNSSQFLVRTLSWERKLSFAFTHEFRCIFRSVNRIRISDFCEKGVVILCTEIIFTRFFCPFLPDFFGFSQSKSGSYRVMETQVETSGIVCVDEPVQSVVFHQKGISFLLRSEIAGSCSRDFNLKIVYCAEHNQ